MEFLLKLIQDSKTEESLRIAAQNIISNRELIRSTFVILITMIIALEVLNLCIFWRVEKKIKKISKKLLKIQKIADKVKD